MKYLSRVLKEEFMGFETIILVNDKTKTEGHKNDVRTFINFTKKHDIMFVKKEKVDDETYKVYFRYFTDEERERRYKTYKIDDLYASEWSDAIVNASKYINIMLGTNYNVRDNWYILETLCRDMKLEFDIFGEIANR